MKILVTGSEGLLGSKLMQILSEKFNTVGIDIKKEEKDVTKKDIINKIKNINPNIIIHTAVLKNVDYCEINKGECYKVNIEGTKNIIEAAKKCNSKLIYISTDFIFDGNKGNYSEENIPNPINYYSKTKFEAEELIKKYSDYLIIRSSVLYGNSTGFNFVKWVIENLKNNKQMKIVTDQINSPTLIDDIAYSLIKLKDENGIYNVVGSEAISRYDFALRIADLFKLNKELIKPITSKELNQKALRPKNVSLDISKIKSLGIKMSNIEEGLLKTYPKVLVGCPTYDGMEYCLEEYIKIIKNLTYPNYDILLVDNSKEDKYFNKIKERKIPVIKTQHYENPKRSIVESRNILRQKVLENYDYFFSLEQDVIPPKDVIERLLAHNKKVISGVYYLFKEASGIKQLAAVLMIGVDENGNITEHKEPDCLVRYMYPKEVEEKRLLKIEASGLGCILIDKDVLKNIKFRYEESKDSFDDVFFSIDIKKNGFGLFVDTSVKCKHLILNK